MTTQTANANLDRNNPQSMCNLAHSLMRMRPEFYAMAGDCMMDAPDFLPSGATENFSYQTVPGRWVNVAVDGLTQR